MESATLALAAAGCRVVTLGIDCPIAEVAAAVRETAAAAVVIEVPCATPMVGGRLKRLRERLARTATLVVTGKGARAVSRCLVLPEPASQYEWARRAA
jgi:methanogenic corrinoid protein MtbC1